MNEIINEKTAENESKRDQQMLQQVAKSLEENNNKK